MIHTICAVAAMIVMYFYYAKLLYSCDAFGLFLLHVLMPEMMLMATRFQSYGSWQKGMILYLLSAIVIHQTFLAQWLPTANIGG